MNETLNILVIHQDESDRRSIQQTLSALRDHLRVCVAIDSIEAAIVQLQQHDFDCVLIGDFLPQTARLLFVQQLRDRGFRVAIVVLTEHCIDRAAVEFIQAGANEYVSMTETLTPEALLIRLRQAIRLYRAELMMQDVTAQLLKSEERYRLIVEGSTDGVWDWDIEKNEVYCSDRLLAILGLSRDTVGTAYSAFLNLIHPDDQHTVQQALINHLHHNALFEVEFRLRHSSGDYCHCTSRGQAQRDRQGIPYRMSGLIHDITQRKRDEAQIMQLNRDLERRVIELQTLFDVIPVGIAIAKDADCAHITINSRLAQQLEMSVHDNASKSQPNPDAVPYQVYQHDRELAPEELPMQRAAATGKALSAMEYDLVLASGQRRKLLAEVSPLRNEQGQVQGCVGAFLDISDRKRIENAQRFLADASALLAMSFDAKTILENLARLAVPFLGDWCMIHTIHHSPTQHGTPAPESKLHLAALHHGDREQLDRYQEIRQQYPLDLNCSKGIGEVLRSGRSKLYPTLTETDLAMLVEDETHLRKVQAIGFRSAMVVPMIARERILGAITFAFSNSDRHYTHSDLELAEEVANRVALAVDNSRLYQATQKAEQNLRQAVLILGEQQQQLRALQNLTDLLNQRLTDVPALLQVMIDSVCAAISDTDFGVIMLYQADSDRLELTATVGLDRELESEPYDLSFRSTLEAVFCSGEPYLHDRDDDPALCAIPIESPDSGRLGVIAIGSRSPNTIFDEDDIELLMAFSEQAAIALTNARLIRTLEEREERLAQQNSMLMQQNQALENQRQQIELQNLKLTEAAKLKSQFLATMSHELRTPMNAIMGFSQLLLRQKNLGEQPTEMVSRIFTNSKNLLTLINDILDLAKIESGRLDLKVMQCHLPTLITATIEELRSLCDQKQLNLYADVQLSNPWILNDHDRLRQILTNLLSNAIKFTDVGSIKLCVREPCPERLEISIKDTGIGISPSNLNHIFEEFRQVDQTIARRYPGTGLGLAITRCLVQMMQGKIEVESEVGVGSTFRVKLPRAVG